MSDGRAIGNEGDLLAATGGVEVKHRGAAYDDAWLDPKMRQAESAPELPPNTELDFTILAGNVTGSDGGPKSRIFVPKAGSAPVGDVVED